MRSLLAELRHRNVLRASAFYVAATWALAQGIAQLSPAFGASESLTRWFVIAAVIGFPFWAGLAWFYKITPEGLKRETDPAIVESNPPRAGRKVDLAIIVVLALAVVLLLTNSLVSRNSERGITHAAAPLPPLSIAVLPFVNLSDGKDQEYLADGISDELSNLLAKVPALQVAARTSSFYFKGKQAGVPEIARTLRVANVLEGSIRRSGDRVRITTQLIRTADGYEIWSQSWDRRLDDIFAIQDDIAADVVKQLQVKLIDSAPTTRSTDPKGYALYLEARQLGYQRSADTLDRSDVLLREVLVLDPRYAPAWTALAMNAINRIGIGAVASDTGYRQANEAAGRALAIDPESAPALGVLGRIANDQGDQAGAARDLQRALAIDPADLDVLRASAILLLSLGRLDESIAVYEYLVARDPVNSMHWSNLGLDYDYAGRFDAAIETQRVVLRLDPTRAATHYELGVALLQKGDAASALSQMQQEPSDVWRAIGLPMALHDLGRSADSDNALATLIEKYANEAPFNIAVVYAYRGDADKAFEWLDKAVASSDPGLADLPVENLFQNIRSDRRWIAFLRKTGYAPAQLSKIDFKIELRG